MTKPGLLTRPQTGLFRGLINAAFRAQLCLAVGLFCLPLGPAEAQSLFAPGSGGAPDNVSPAVKPESQAAPSSFFSPRDVRLPDEPAADPVQPEPPPVNVVGPTAVGQSGWSTPAPRIHSQGGSGTSQIMVDAQGNKTLVVRGDSPVMLGEEGQQTQVVFGDDTAGVFMDDNGHKTLVVRGEAVDASTRRRAAQAAEGRPNAPEKRRGTVDKRCSAEKPYWVVDKPAEERPYFMAEPKVE